MSDALALAPGALIWARMRGFGDRPPARRLSLGTGWWPAVLDQTDVGPPGKPLKHEVSFAFPAAAQWGGMELSPKQILVTPPARPDPSPRDQPFDGAECAKLIRAANEPELLDGIAAVRQGRGWGG